MPTMGNWSCITTRMNNSYGSPGPAGTLVLTVEEKNMNANPRSLSGTITGRDHCLPPTVDR